MEALRLALIDALEIRITRSSLDDANIEAVEEPINFTWDILSYDQH